jgi:hypothetical protein
MRWVRSLVVLVAFIVAAGAIVWVGAIGFHDHTSGVDCGVPVASALHAKTVPRLSNGSDLQLTNACVGEARTRIAVAVAVVLVSAAAGVFIVRYRRPRNT